jgi:NitT/TauT family transport system ATP-binding protein
VSAEPSAAVTAPPDQGGAPLVALRGVAKLFANGTQALADLDLAIGRHEFVSLLGPSGCGKSTALRLIAGLTRVSRGRIEWPQGEGLGDIGFVFQEPTLMPWASVFDNVRLPLRLQGKGRAAVAGEVEAALAMVGLSGFAGAYPRELSGGMKMRVSIARALVTKPKLLLMDEPFAALDALTRDDMQRLLADVWRETRKTVVYVTHNVAEAVYLADRVVVMTPHPGTVKCEVPIRLTRPRDPLSVEFLDYQKELLRHLGNEVAKA